MGVYAERRIFVPSFFLFDEGTYQGLGLERAFVKTRRCGMEDSRWICGVERQRGEVSGGSTR